MLIQTEVKTISGHVRRFIYEYPDETVFVMSQGMIDTGSLIILKQVESQTKSPILELNDLDGGGLKVSSVLRVGSISRCYSGTKYTFPNSIRIGMVTQDIPLLNSILLGLKKEDPEKYKLWTNEIVPLPMDRDTQRELEKYVEDSYIVANQNLLVAAQDALQHKICLHISFIPGLAFTPYMLHKLKTLNIDVSKYKYKSRRLSLDNVKFKSIEPKSEGKDVKKKRKSIKKQKKIMKKCSRMNNCYQK